MAEIQVAETNQDVAVARELFLEYAEGLGIDLCFQGFSEELEKLPGDYAAPAGRLLVARNATDAVGCIALRPMAEQAVCEMKRLYVRPQHRGRGLGRQLVERVIAEAHSIGYARMRLHTLAVMETARLLYSRLGFVQVDSDDHDTADAAVYMELSL